MFTYLNDDSMGAWLQLRTRGRKDRMAPLAVAVGQLNFPAWCTRAKVLDKTAPTVLLHNDPTPVWGVNATFGFAEEDDNLVIFMTPDKDPDSWNDDQGQVVVYACGHYYRSLTDRMGKPFGRQYGVAFTWDEAEPEHLWAMQADWLPKRLMPKLDSDGLHPLTIAPALFIAGSEVGGDYTPTATPMFWFVNNDRQIDRMTISSFFGCDDPLEEDESAFLCRTKGATAKGDPNVVTKILPGTEYGGRPGVKVQITRSFDGTYHRIRLATTPYNRIFPKGERPRDIYRLLGHLGYPHLGPLAMGRDLEGYDRGLEWTAHKDNANLWTYAPLSLRLPRPSAPLPERKIIVVGGTAALPVKDDAPTIAGLPLEQPELKPTTDGPEQKLPGNGTTARKGGVMTDFQQVADHFANREASGEAVDELVDHPETPVEGDGSDAGK